MNKLLSMVVVLFTVARLAGTPVQAQVIQRPNAKAAQKGQAAPIPASTIPALIMDFYISRLPVEVELTDGQTAKVLPPLRQWLQERRVLEPRRARAINQLRQAINRGGSEEELNRLVREADQVVADQQASHQKFLAIVDPALSVRQRAKLRVFQENIEQRILRMIESARVAAQQQRNATQPPKPPPIN